MLSLKDSSYSLASNSFPANSISLVYHPHKKTIRIITVIIIIIIIITTTTTTRKTIIDNKKWNGLPIFGAEN